MTPPGSAATLNATASFIKQVNDFSVAGIKAMHEHNFLEAQKEVGKQLEPGGAPSRPQPSESQHAEPPGSGCLQVEREADIRHQAKERAEYKRKKKAETLRLAKAEADERARLESAKLAEAEERRARRAAFAKQKASVRSRT